MDLNYYILLVFAPLLIVAGILGFAIPKGKALTSGAPAYNLFHIVFGMIGVCIVLSRNDSLIRSFNVVFGVIDLYQAAASYMNLFPQKYFEWKRADDILHVVIGTLLVFVGITG